MGQILIEDFIQFITTTLKYFKPVALGMALSFLTIDLVLTYINGEQDFFKTLPAKTLKYGFFLWIIIEYNQIILKTIINGAIQMGNYATGNTSTDLLVSPFQFFFDLLALVTPFFAGAGTVITGLDLAGIESIPIAFNFLLLGIFLTAMGISLEIILTVIEYYLIAICAILLMPFGLWSKTNNFAMRGLSSLFGQSFKILLFTMLLNFLEIQWTRFLTAPFTLNIYSLVTSLFNLIILYFLIKRVSAIAGALLGGTGISSTGSSALLAGFAMGAYGKVGGILRDSYNDVGGFSGLKDRVTETYKNATTGVDDENNILS